MADALVLVGGGAAVFFLSLPDSANAVTAPDHDHRGDPAGDQGLVARQLRQTGDHALLLADSGGLSVPELC